MDASNVRTEADRTPPVDEKTFTSNRRFRNPTVVKFREERERGFQCMAPSSLDAAIVDSTSQRLAAVDLLEQNNTRKKKEDMDADQVMDVPDTPDRLASQKINSSLDKVQNRELLGREVLKGIKGSGRLSSCQHNSKRFSSNSVNASRIMDEYKPSNSDGSKSDHDQLGTVGFGDRISMKLVSKPSAKTLPVESSSANGSPNITESLYVHDRSQDDCRGNMIDLQQKIPCNNLRHTKNKDSGRNMLMGSGNSSTCKDLSMDASNFKNVYEDSEKYERASHIGTSKNHAFGEIGMGSTFDGTHKEAHGKTRAADSVFLPPDIAMSAQISSNALKGVNKGGAGTYRNHVDLTTDSLDGGHGKWVDSQPGNERNGSMSQSVNPPRRGQRRLVRNGCISPYNVAKSLGSSVKKENDVTDDKQVGNGKIACSNLSEGITPSFEGNQMNRVKGKGIINSTVPANEYNGRSTSTSSSSRHLLVLDEEDNFKSAEDKNGWRSTHNRSKKTCLHPSQETKSSTKRRSGFVWNLGATENGDPVKDLNTDIAFLEVKDSVSLQSAGSVQHQASSSSMSGPMLEKERQRGVQKLIKRRRKSTLSRNRVGECSSLASDDSDVSLICPSGKSNLGLNKSNRSLRIGRLGPVIEVDELCSPEITSSNSSQEACIISDDSNTRDRQVEADEELARQLQEQFYNELPGVGAGESDASIALTLQHQEDAHATSVGNHHRHPRDSSMAHLYRYRLQSFQNSSVGLASHGQVPTRARMTQLRRRLNITTPTASSSSGRSFQFPSNMNLDTRLRLLEALEAADDAMAMTNQFLQVQRDFNENDYEMLLALDDDNHQHGGASINQINSLPESKVQTDNFEEACTICLETPSTGDTIRHLPCLHKFHKECIDPWLRRRKSCPICKSDIT